MLILNMQNPISYFLKHHKFILFSAKIHFWQNNGSNESRKEPVKKISSSHGSTHVKKENQVEIMRRNTLKIPPAF